MRSVEKSPTRSPNADHTLLVFGSPLRFQRNVEQVVQPQHGLQQHQHAERDDVSDQATASFAFDRSDGVIVGRVFDSVVFGVVDVVA